MDGTVNPYPGETDHEKVVYGRDGFDPWIENGTSLVLRRIHMNVDTWDEADTPAREDAVGRKLADGAPLTGSQEHDEPNFEAKGSRPTVTFGGPARTIPTKKSSAVSTTTICRWPTHRG